jgi:hypothetical protein
LFVSTPDLLLDVPRATWLPLSVDVDRWQCSRVAFDERVPTILHAPSRTNPPIKGSRIIEPVLRRLNSRGAIRYLSAAGVPHEHMPELVSHADIVVDQIQTGSYGVAAVEGMAAGRLVVGYVAEDVRAMMPEQPPIVDAPKELFEAKIEEVLDDVSRFAVVASRGPDFVGRWHSGYASAMALGPFLKRPSPREFAQLSIPSFA